MTISRKRPAAATSAVLTAFWDTNGVVPLCCFQPQTAKARQAARTYSRQVVWWGTVVEAVSSFNRLVREGHLSSKEGKQAFARLDHLRIRWNEVQPTEEVRGRACSALTSCGRRTPYSYPPRSCGAETARADATSSARTAASPTPQKQKV